MDLALLHLLLHVLLDVVDLRRLVLVRVLPLAVQVLALDVAPRVAHHDAVRVHDRHDLEDVQVAQEPRLVRVAHQEFDNAYSEGPAVALDQFQQAGEERIG